ncbi:putative P-type H(+)-exporting transporter [Helianthus anomalus]
MCAIDFDRVSGSWVQLRGLFFYMHKALEFLGILRDDSDTYQTGQMHIVSKGAPEKILNPAHNKPEIANKVHWIINKFPKHWLQSIGVACQVIQLFNTASMVNILTLIIKS